MDENHNARAPAVSTASFWKLYLLLVAWWLMHVAKSDSWNTHIIAVMARWAVKLKFIALDPVHWVKKVLAKGEDVMRQIETEQKDEAIIQVQLLLEPGKEGQKIIFPEDSNLAKPYYESKSHFRDVLLEMIHGVLENLNIGLLSSNSVELSIRTLIYRSGLSRTLRQLAVHQNGQLSTTSGGREFQYGHMAFQLLVSNSQSIVNCKPAAPNVANVCWHHVVNGKVSPVYQDREERRTDKLDDIISILIPLSFMENSHMVERFQSALAWTIAHEDPNSQKLDLPSEETLELEFSITTTPKMIRLPALRDPDIVPSSQSPLFTGLEEEMTNLKNRREIFHSRAARELKRKALEHFNAYKRGELEQKSWAICESSVRVKTTKYSTIVLTFAIIIILGSLCIPFLVGERIKGVDPFQIVTFAWLLAGAFLIGAKSRYVDEWPWHDFLRGQIICCSVSELAQASRLREQTILLYLLQNEFKKPLKFRGAFIGPFSPSSFPASGDDAFNIDVALDHATVLAAGFIVLKVWDKNGWHLLLHDSRDDTTIHDGLHLVYNGLESDEVNSNKKKELREDQRARGPEFLKLERGSLFDHKVLGQYVKDCQFG